jgi:cytochrome c553
MIAISNGNYIRAALVAVGIGLTATPAIAGDAAAGKAKAAVCAACHGQDGKTPIDPSYAILAGQHEDYLVIALKGYRSGLRKNAIMGAQAQQLSTADIENLAAYYASLPGPMGYKK